MKTSTTAVLALLLALHQSLAEQIPLDVLRRILGKSVVGTDPSHPLHHHFQEGGGNLLGHDYHRQQNKDVNRELQFVSPTVINPLCDSSKDVLLGPHALLKELTDPSVYDKTKRPSVSYHPSRPISPYPDLVWNTISLSDIVLLDELTQSLTTSFFDVYTWIDARLSFNATGNGACVVPGIFPGTPTLDLSLDQFSDGVDKIIWTPSVITSNVQYTYVGMGVGFITEIGSVTMVMQKEIRTDCEMHFGKYPFDKHECFIDVNTLGQSPYDVQLIAGELADGASGGDFFSNALKNNYQVGEFEAVDTTTGTSVGLFPGISGSIKFVRNAKYFTTSILLPDILLHISLYTGFWIDRANAQARVGLCVISGLSFRYLMSSISVKLPAVTYNIWVVDYMLASTFLAVLALIEYGIVQYYLNTELKRLKLLEGFQKSNISDMLRRRVVKASTIFEQAELKYAEFLAAAKDARSSKISLSKQQSTSPAYSRSTSNVEPSSDQANTSKGTMFGRHGRRHKKNKVGTVETMRNMMLEMIKIEEAEETEEEEGDELDPELGQGKIASSSPTPPLPVSQALRMVAGVATYEPNSEEVTNALSQHVVETHNQSNKDDNLVVMNYPESDPSDCDSECSSRPQSSGSPVGQGELRTSKIGSASKSVGRLMQPSSNRSSVNSNSSGYSGYSNSRRSSFRDGRSRHGNKSDLRKANTLLTTYEVMTIAYVKEAYEKFDTDHNGVLTIQELKMCFRAFGKYYTTNQVCALLEAFRTSLGSSLAKKPTLHFVDFFCLLVELEQHEPLPEFATRDYLAIPPSLIVDMFMRLFFPVFVSLKIFIFFSILNDY